MLRIDLRVNTAITYSDNARLKCDTIADYTLSASLTPEIKDEIERDFLFIFVLAKRSAERLRGVGCDKETIHSFLLPFAACL